MCLILWHVPGAARGGQAVLPPIPGDGLDAAAHRSAAPPFPAPRASDIIGVQGAGPVQGPAIRSGGMSDNDKRGGTGPNTGVVVRARPKTRKPAMYKVLMLNDDYTPMEFVVHVLERFFQKTREEATRIMLHVHRRGVGVCGTYTYEVAETKVTQVMDLARQNQHPLQCTIEKE
jgi:ATP-dependent Clp protease adaptor protein ClpS